MREATFRPARRGVAAPHWLAPPRATPPAISTTHFEDETPRDFFYSNEACYGFCLMFISHLYILYFLRTKFVSYVEVYIVLSL